MAEKKMIQRDSTTEVGLNELRARIASGDRAEHSKSTEAMLDAGDTRTQVAAGVVDGMALVMSDTETMDKFWRRGYESLAGHTSAGASVWIGKRLLTAFVLVVVTYGLIYLIKTRPL